jgi:thioredoxin 1
MSESKNVLTFTDANFDAEVLKSDRPVLVDFWAVWCAPCRMISPLMDQLADSYGSRLRVGKVNIDESPGIPNRYGIRSIPTVVLFREGKMVDQVIGANPNDIKRLVEKV